MKTKGDFLNNTVGARKTYRRAVATCLLLGSVLMTASAQVAEQAAQAYEGVGIDQRLGAVVPDDLVFQNEVGETVPLGAYFDGARPVILTFVYHTCPMLCNTLLDGFTGSLAAMAWTPGQEFEVLTISFNAIDTPELASRQKARYVAQLGKQEAAEGWHFLTGDEAAINALTQAVGFNYRWVEQQQEYAHPAVLIFLTGDGTIARYLPDFRPRPLDLRATLVETSEGSVGSVLDRVFLYCFQFDPTANSYALHATNAMKIGGLLTVLALIATLFVLWRREVRSRDVAHVEPLHATALRPD